MGGDAECDIKNMGTSSKHGSRVLWATPFHVKHLPACGRVTCPLCNNSRPLISFVPHRVHCQICEDDTQDAKRALAEQEAQDRELEERYAKYQAFVLAPFYEAAPSYLTSTVEVVRRKRVISVLRSAAKRSYDKGMEFNLSVEWAEDKIKSGRCEVTGLQFEVAFDLETGSTIRSPWHPTIDRRDNSKGYTPENAQMVVWIYNRAKAEHHEDDVLRMAHALCRVGT